MLERPYMLKEGTKRERNKTDRLEIKEPISGTKEKAQLDVPKGSGEQLGELPNVVHFLGKTNANELKDLYRVLYGRAGTVLSCDLHISNTFYFT